MLKKYFTALVLGVSVFLTACSPYVELSITPDDFLVVSLDSSRAKETRELLESLSPLWGGGPLFTTQALEAGFTRAGLEAVQVQSVDGFTFHAEGKAKAPVLLRGNRGLAAVCAYEAGQLRITMTPAGVEEILMLLPPGTADFKDLLLSPLFTGESMVEKEYLDLVAAVYGGRIADYLKKSTLTLVFTAPKPLKGTIAPEWAQTKTMSPRTVAWTMPLPALLTKREELRWQAAW